jgi:hypothetical protein
MWAVDTVRKNSVLIGSIQLLLKITVHHIFLKNKHFSRRNSTTTTTIPVLSPAPQYQPEVLNHSVGQVQVKDTNSELWTEGTFRPPH